MQSKRIKWENHQHLINKIPDQDLADLIGCKIQTVITKRNRLGCLKRKKAPRIDWSPWESLLGKVPDKEIANSIGCEVAAVRSKRHREGILIGTPYEFIDWDKWHHLVGVLSDAELSRKISCHRATVSAYRRSKGIPSVEQYPWSDEDENLKKQNKRKCIVCEKIQNIHSFQVDKRGRNGVKRYCKNCKNSKDREYRFHCKQDFVKLLGGKCSHCNFDAYQSSLQFHHVHPKQKLFDISTKIKPSELKLVTAELDKCALLCANCHRAYHGKDICLTFVKSKEIGWTVKKSSEDGSLLKLPD